jgi:excisionase family DNA binding protein
MNADTPFNLIDTWRAAELLDVPHRYLLRLVRLNRIPYYRLPGDEIRFDTEALSAWLREHQVASEVPL